MHNNKLVCEPIGYFGEFLKQMMSVYVIQDTFGKIFSP